MSARLIFPAGGRVGNCYWLWTLLRPLCICIGLPGHRILGRGASWSSENASRVTTNWLTAMAACEAHCILRKPSILTMVLLQEYNSEHFNTGDLPLVHEPCHVSCSRGHDTQ